MGLKITERCARLRGSLRVADECDLEQSHERENHVKCTFALILRRDDKPVPVPTAWFSIFFFVFFLTEPHASGGEPKIEGVVPPHVKQNSSL